MGNVLELIKFYLIDHKQYVTVNEVNPISENIHYGIPHESVLGPLLFILFINNLKPISNSCYFILFADYTINLFRESSSIALNNIKNNPILILNTLLNNNNKLTLNSIDQTVN